MASISSILGDRIIDIYYEGNNIVVRYANGDLKTVPNDEKNFIKYLDLIHNQNKHDMDRHNKRILKYTKLLILAVALMCSLPFVGYYYGGFIVCVTSIGFTFPFFIKSLDELQDSLRESLKQDEIIRKSIDLMITSKKNRINGISHITELVKINYPQYVQNDIIITSFAQTYYKREDLSDDEIISLFAEFIVFYKERSEKMEHISDDDNISIIGNKSNLPKLVIDEEVEPQNKGRVLEFKKTK